MESSFSDEDSYVSSSVFDLSQVSQVSQNTIICDSKVKKRIVEGVVTFLPDIWSDKMDGTTSLT